MKLLFHYWDHSYHNVDKVSSKIPILQAVKQCSCLYKSNVKMVFQLPEASSQALFADSQAHVWALEGRREMAGYSSS